MGVTIYTTPSCGYCRIAKDWMRKQGLAFTEYNVASDLRKAEEMYRKSGSMGVPVLDVNGRIIVGFDQKAIEEALRR